MNNNIQDGKLKILANIQNPNEFIAACRTMAAEENQMSEGDMFPLTEDSLGDVIYTFVGIWLAMSASLPLENKEQVIAITNNMAEMLKLIQNNLSDNPEQFKSELLHCLKRAMAPRLWDISSIQ